MIRALIFDFDGLILETEGPCFQSWEQVYQAYGQELSFSNWAQNIGTTVVMFDPQQDLQARLGKPLDWAAIEPKRAAHELSLIEHQSVLPGVLAYLKSARRLGLKLGLASSSSCQWVLGHLARLGLVEYFDCIRASDDVKHVKPDPGLYLAVLAALKVRGGEAIAFEDSPKGILSAKQAGLYCVAVPNVLTKQLPLNQADLQLLSLEDLPLEELLERVQSS